jgi:multidrug transporter EmrE-like cation transporter
VNGLEVRLWSRDYLLFLLPLGFLTLGQGAAKVGAMTGQGEWYLVSYAALLLRGLVWIVVLRRFPLSLAYPMMSLGYLSVLILSVLVFSEPVPRGAWVGIPLILLGVGLIQTREGAAGGR